MLLPISAFIICKNEQDVIQACLRSVDFCEDIVVVDSGSTDGTLQIINALQAEGMPIRIFHEEWRGFGGQKQFALEQCNQPWCLSLDSDERVSPKLRVALPDLIAASEVNGYALDRFNYLPAYGYVPVQSAEKRLNRLFRRGFGRLYQEDIVHERLDIDGPVVDLSAGQGGILHFSPLRLHDQVLKLNRYSSLKAEMRAARGAEAKPIKMLLSPLVYFLRLYFGHGLWRCHWPGVIAAANGAVYAYLSEAKRFEDEALMRMPTVEPQDVSDY